MLVFKWSPIIVSVAVVAGVLAAAAPASAVVPPPSVTVENGGGAAAAVAVDDTLSVKSTSPVAGDGAVQQTIENTWSASQAQTTTGSVVAPEGWTSQYTADGSTWGPAPGDQTTITGVRAIGNVTGDTTLDGVATVTSAPTGTFLVSASFSGSSGGDGWNVFFAGTKALNVWHHSAGRYNLDCHLKTTGASCGAVYGINGYQTSNESGGSVVNNKVYSFVGRIHQAASACCVPTFPRSRLSAADSPLCRVGESFETGGQRAERGFLSLDSHSDSVD